MTTQIKILDTTLRDGSQMEGVSFSISDKIKIAHALDDFGIAYLEGGFPGSNQKEKDFFRKIKKENFKNIRVAAFGSTRHKNNQAKNDPSLLSILESGVSLAVIFGKTWDFQVTDILKTSLEENLDIIGSSVDFLVSQGVEVIFDAEHFYDGFIGNADYSLRCIQEAQKAGARNITLCDTNGGTLPSQIYEITQAVAQKINISIGIHAHNDSECAVANSLAAVEAGADLVHGTINGYGERCGNANFCSLVPNLALKTKYQLNPKVKLEKTRSLALFVAELANLTLEKKKAFVGENAFTHKAGIHASAVNKNPKAYEHIDPQVVGNANKITVSELSGKSNIMAKASTLGLKINKETAEKILKKVKKNEKKGFCYEDAEASLFLLMRKIIKAEEIPFKVNDFFVIAEKGRRGKKMISEAIVNLKIKGKHEHVVSVGNGPVNALDMAIRKALQPFFPVLKEVQLVDYKVRIVDGKSGTEAITRVLIESNFKGERISAVGASGNIIKASFQALMDTYTYLIWMIGKLE